MLDDSPFLIQGTFNTMMADSRSTVFGVTNFEADCWGISFFVPYWASVSFTLPTSTKALRAECSSGYRCLCRGFSGQSIIGSQGSTGTILGTGSPTLGALKTPR